MSKKVRDMVKNVIEENAVEFKKNTANAIYEKLNYRLGKEYVKVSKNFLTIKEDVDDVVAASVSQNAPSDSAMIGRGGGGAGGAPKPPSGTPGGKPGTKPKDPFGPGTREPPYAEDPGKWTGGERPSKGFPKENQGESDTEYQKRLNEWLRAREEYLKQLETYKNWQKWRKNNPNVPSRNLPK